jgi:polyisoprenoid-binding protein YceI
MRILAGIFVFLNLLFCGTPGYGETSLYQIDGNKSELVVRLFRGGLVGFMGHNHVIRATEISGSIQIDPENFSSFTAYIEVKTASLKADEPEIRKKHKLKKKVRDKDRKKIQNTMESAEQLDVKKFPLMTFKATKVEKEEKDQYLIHGDLTMHGVTRRVSLLMSAKKEESQVVMEGSLKFKQSDFGIKPFSAVFGSVKNQDEAILYIELVASLQQSPAN